MKYILKHYDNELRRFFINPIPTTIDSEEVGVDRYYFRHSSYIQQMLPTYEGDMI